VAFFKEAGFAVNLVTEDEQTVSSANVYNLLQLLSVESGSCRVVWVIQEQIVVLPLELLQKIFKLGEIYLKLAVLGVRWNVVVLILSKFRLWHIRYP